MSDRFDIDSYTEVKELQAMVKEEWPEYRLRSSYEFVTLTQPTWEARYVNRKRTIVYGEMEQVPYVIVRAEFYRHGQDDNPSSGTSWMRIPGTTGYTTGSELENAETSAWGRALRAAGYGSGATREEVQNKQEVGVGVVQSGSQGAAAPTPPQPSSAWPTKARTELAAKAVNYAKAKGMPTQEMLDRMTAKYGTANPQAWTDEQCDMLAASLAPKNGGQDAN